MSMKIITVFIDADNTPTFTTTTTPHTRSENYIVKIIRVTLVKNNVSKFSKTESVLTL